jgi:hypothetical protein
MGKKRIRVGPGGKIRIKRKSKSESEPDRRSEPDRESSPSERTDPKSRPDPKPADTEGDLEVPEELLGDHAERVTEAQVRPEDPTTDGDVELIYAFSGEHRERLDSFHGLSSSEIIREATERSIRWIGSAIVDHVSAELDRQPGVVVFSHTHPSGGTTPSSTDLHDGWPGIARAIRDEWAGCRVVFAIHGLGDEFSRPRGRTDPTVRNDRVEWRSTKREHRVQFYDHDADTIRPRVI